MLSRFNSILRIETEKSNKIFNNFFIIINLLFLIVSIVFYKLGNQVYYWHLQFHLFFLIFLLIPVRFLLIKIDNSQFFKYLLFILYIFYIFSIVLVNKFDYFHLVILLSINVFGLIYISKRLYIISSIIIILTAMYYLYFISFFGIFVENTFFEALYKTLLLAIILVGGYFGLSRMIRLLDEVLNDDASPYKDDLTGAFNKHYLKEKISNMTVDEELQLSIIALNINDMKQINSKYGYRAGDMILQEFTNIVQRITRNTDSIYRTEGNKFVIILQHPKEFDAKNLAQRIKNMLQNNKFNITDKNNNQIDINITSSFGVVSLKEGENIDELLVRAEKSLQEAKQNDESIIQE